MEVADGAAPEVVVVAGVVAVAEDAAPSVVEGLVPEAPVLLAWASSAAFFASVSARECLRA